MSIKIANIIVKEFSGEKQPYYKASKKDEDILKRALAKEFREGYPVDIGKKTIRFKGMIK